MSGSVGAELNLDVAAIIKETGALLAAAKGNSTKKPSSAFNMPFPKLDKKKIGKPSFKSVKAQKSIEWQSNNDDIMEYFGLQEKSGYDVRFTAAIQYKIVKFENIVEPIVRDLIVYGGVQFNTVAAYVMSSKMSYDISLATAPNDDRPRGVVYFDCMLDTGLDRDNGRFTFDISGETVKANGRWG